MKFSTHNMKAIYIIICIFLIFPENIFCQSAEKGTRKEYIETYKELAIKEMKISGIPASITLAQGMLESDNGNSRLAKKAKNHFGIKCHSGWTGKKFHKDDDAKNECFRKYNSVYDSFCDHTDFLSGKQRYAFLFELKPTDYKSWAKGLKKAGYATNPKYPELLIRIIEDNELYIYDTSERAEVIAKAEEKKEKKITKRRKKSKVAKLGDVDNFTIVLAGRKILQKNRINYIRVKKGDTFYKIANELDIMLWQLYKYNDLSKNSILKEGRLLYIQPKRNKSEFGRDFHIIKEGENMYFVSQLFGIKLKSLYRKNLMPFGSEPETGRKLWLRRTKR